MPGCARYPLTGGAVDGILDLRYGGVRMRFIDPVLPILLLLTGCVTPRFIANNMTDSVRDIKSAFFAENSPQHAMAAGPGLLMQLDGFLVSAPENGDLLLLGAEMNCSYAMTFLDTRDRQWAASQYAKGLGYAIRNVKLENSELGNALEAADEAEVVRLLADADEEHLPDLFWTALCWGGYINARMDAETAADLPIVESLIGWTVAVNPEYYFGAGHLFYGMLFSSRSKLLGGDLEKGREHFEKAIAITKGSFLLPKVMFARSYAVNKQDAELFVSLLNEVVAADVDLPELRIANRVAVADARELLEKVGDYFPDWQEPVDPVEDGDGFVEEDAEDLDLD